MPRITEFINKLKCYSAPEVYNPWKDFDGKYDIGVRAPMIRCGQFEKYLRMRINEARFIFTAEALGYQGGHFTGIAMTSERMILGNHAQINSSHIIGEPGIRTSNPEFGKDRVCMEKGYNEPTATIVWDAVLRHCKTTADVVLWNIFPFHPYKKNDVLTNRTPTEQELIIGADYMKMLCSLMPQAKIIAIGRKSAGTLSGFGIEHQAVPHPANGGASDFREGIAKYF